MFEVTKFVKIVSIVVACFEVYNGDYFALIHLIFEVWSLIKHNLIKS